MKRLRSMKPATLVFGLLLAVMAAASCVSEKQSGSNGGRTEVRNRTGAVAADSSPEVPVDVMPKTLTTKQPVYPESARTQGLEGTVFVKALVGKEGTVKQAIADESRSPSPLLAQSAVEAIRQWTFSPASYHGEPVEIWIVVPVKFALH